ncbi:MAG TPA: hypothetical protein VJX92_27145 [Methylomirabilota bacterium]|nr:hypothetical protein [Methylomirabilota bacterium]
MITCQATREELLSACLSGRPAPEEAHLHARGCPECAEETRRLAETWAALAALPLLEPSAQLSRRLRRRIRWEVAREALASVGSWQRAALAGVGGFALSFLLSLLLPYDVMVTLCRTAAPETLPAATAYLVAGFLYGLVPMAIVAGFRGGRGQALAGLVGVLEASIVFLVVAVPYVVAACGFPPPLLVGFVTGIALGALGGGATVVELRRRIAWT